MSGWFSGTYKKTYNTKKSNKYLGIPVDYTVNNTRYRKRL